MAAGRPWAPRSRCQMRFLGCSSPGLHAGLVAQVWGSRAALHWGRALQIHALYRIYVNGQVCLSPGASGQGQPSGPEGNEKGICGSRRSGREELPAELSIALATPALGSHAPERGFLYFQEAVSWYN